MVVLLVMTRLFHHVCGHRAGVVLSISSHVGGGWNAGSV